MPWLERNAWWLLLVTPVISVPFGLGDLLSGAPDNSLAVTGLTNAELAAVSGQAYRLIEVQIRAGGLQLILIGALFAAIVLFGFRRNLRWAWWTMWALPIFTAAIVALHLTTVGPGQMPPIPAYTGAVFTAINAGILLASRRRFFDRRATA